MLSPDQLRVRRRLIEDIGGLPTLPTVVAKLAALSPSADDYFDQVTRLAAQDPTMATRVLIVANSSANRGTAPVKTIPDAVVRLGARGVSNLLTAIGMTQVMAPKGHFEKTQWVHALEVAAAGRAIARVLRDKAIHPEETYLAGLVHDLGRIILFHEASEELKKTSEGEWETPEDLLRSEIELCGVDHTELGGRACRKWGLPEELCLVVRHHHAAEIHEELTEERFRLIEIIQAADRLLFSAEPPVGPGVSALGDPELGALIADSLPFWVTLDPWSLLGPIREATESAHHSARAMGMLA